MVESLYPLVNIQKNTIFNSYVCVYQRVNNGMFTTYQLGISQPSTVSSQVFFVARDVPHALLHKPLRRQPKGRGFHLYHVDWATLWAGKASTTFIIAGLTVKKLML